MRVQPALVLLSMLTSLCTACRKDKDSSAPSITILAPGAGSTVAVPDTLVVRVAVEDDHIVESVWIAVTNTDGVPIAAPITASPGSTSAVVEGGIPMTDERIAQGSYTLTVRVSDGPNSRSAFLTLGVQAAPLRLRAIFIATPAGTTAAEVLRIDSTGAVASFTTLSDLSGAVADGYGQHVVIAGGTMSDMVAVPTAGYAHPWSVPNLNATGTPYFAGLRLDPADGRIYFGTNDGFIRGVTGEGAQTFTAQVPGGYRSRLTAVVGDRLVSAQAAIALPEHRMATHAYPSGQFVAAFPLDMEPVALDQRTEQNALFFGNIGVDGVIQDRSIGSGGSFVVRQFPGERIQAVQRIDANTWAIALAGRIVRFTYPTNGLVVLAPGVSADALAYEAATGRLYAGVGAQLLFMDHMNGSVLESMDLPYSIGAILPLLNR